MAIVAIGAIIAGASAAAAAYAAGAALALAIGIGVAVAAVSALMSTQMAQNVPRFNSTDTATTLGTTSDPSSVIPIIYGEQRTGTINVWKAVGVDTTYLVQIFAICEGEVDSFKTFIWIIRKSYLMAFIKTVFFRKVQSLLNISNMLKLNSQLVSHTVTFLLLLRNI